MIEAERYPERPHCAFPKVPKYGGSGDTNVASNFACVDNGKVVNQLPADEYLR